MPKPDLIGMVVKDMPTTLRLYRRLGMEIPASADNDGHVAETSTVQGLAGGACDEVALLVREMHSLAIGALSSNASNAGFC